MSKDHIHPTIREGLADKGFHLPPRPAPAAPTPPASGRLRESDEEYRRAAREIVALGERREPPPIDHGMDSIFGQLHQGSRLFECSESEVGEASRPGDRLFGSANRDAPMPSAPDSVSEQSESGRFQEHEPTPVGPDRAFDRIFGPAE
jgi:hypothetical protein